MASGLSSVTQGVKVAVFVIALAIATFIIYRMVAKDGSGSGHYTVYTRLEDATGLVPKSRVKIAGIAVGYIDAIVLDNGKAKVVVKMDKGIDLHTNATAAKRSSSLLGEYNLVLTPGTEDQPKIPDGGEIKNAIDVASTDKIMADLAVIAEKVKQVSTQVAGAFGTEEGGKQMQAVLKNLAEVSKEINETVKENRKSVSETIKNIERLTNTSVPKINKVLDNVAAVTGDFKDLLEADRNKLKVDPNSGVASMSDTLERINAASKNLESTMKHADNVLGKIDKGDGTLGRLTNDNTLINEVEGVASDIHEFTSGISRLQTVVGLRSEYYIRSNGIKSYVEVRLQPREDKYYMIELISDPRGKTTLTQIDVNSTDPNKPAFYRETRNETTNSFRFSFMFARRLGPATFMFGIRESTGGIGLGLHALDDRLTLQSDLFGFGENVRPRLRERLEYEFVRRLFVVLGVDDFFNTERTDYFFGAQLRFTDDDLKAVLPFASFRP